MGAVAGERPLGLPALVVEVVVNLRFSRRAVDGSGEQWIGGPEALGFPAVFLDQLATAVVFTDQPLFVLEEWMVVPVSGSSFFIRSPMGL